MTPTSTLQSARTTITCRSRPLGFLMATATARHPAATAEPLRVDFTSGITALPRSSMARLFKSGLSTRAWPSLLLACCWHQCERCCLAALIRRSLFLVLATMRIRSCPQFWIAVLFNLLALKGMTQLPPARTMAVAFSHLLKMLWLVCLCTTTATLTLAFENVHCTSCVTRRARFA